MLQHTTIARDGVQFCAYALDEPAAPPQGKLLLASASARRRELLFPLAGAFEVLTFSIPEPRDPSRSVAEQAQALAVRKALHGHSLAPGRLVLGADTLVALDGAVFGKPRDEQDAAQILQKLSGRTHQVTTGVALCAPGRCWAGCETTEVTFRPLTPDEIERYVSAGEWRDKAGGYGIQGQASVFVARIAGSLSNVIGLPEALVRAMLAESSDSCTKEVLF